MTDPKPDQKALSIIEEGMYSHMRWRDFLRVNPDYSDTDVGSIEHHEEWIANYEYLRDLLMKG